MNFMPDWMEIEKTVPRGEKAKADFAPLNDNDEEKIHYLNGEWAFNYSEHTAYAPDGFEEDGYDVSKWDKITVPSCWQLCGYGRKHYSNVRFPYPADPPYVPQESGVGCYKREFTVPDEWEGEKIYLTFEGVRSSFFVWVNGISLGFGQGSHTRNRYDITEVVKNGINTVSVKVYQLSHTSYLEDQDMWRLNGIFRDVYISSQIKEGLSDIFIKTDLINDYNDGVLHCEMTFDNPRGIVELTLCKDGNLYCKCTMSGLAGNVGMSICTGDSHYTDCIVIDYTIGVDILMGSVKLTRVHVWGGPVPPRHGETIPEMLVDSISFRVNAPDVTLNDCYADTGEIGFQIHDCTRLNNCTYLSTYSVFPLNCIKVIDHQSGHLTASHCYFRQFEFDRNECMVYCGNGENLYADDIIVEGDGFKDAEEFAVMIKKEE